MQPSEDERILAALTHASIIANVVNLAGMIATAVIWTPQRERSEYVRRHALQSLIYQGMVLVIFILFMIFWGICVGFSLLPAAMRPDLYRNSPPGLFWIALLALALPLGFGILTTIYGLYGAFQVYHNKPFYYPLAGRFVRPSAAATPASPAADSSPSHAPDAAPSAAPAELEQNQPPADDDPQP